MNSCPGYCSRILRYTRRKKRVGFWLRCQSREKRFGKNYIELHFTFTSLYSAELNDPPNLKGKIVKKYRYFNGRISPRGE